MTFCSSLPADLRTPNQVSLVGSSYSSNQHDEFYFSLGEAILPANHMGARTQTLGRCEELVPQGRTGLAAFTLWIKWMYPAFDFRWLPLATHSALDRKFGKSTVVR